jgi:rare lipoprotein A
MMLPYSRLVDRHFSALHIGRGDQSLRTILARASILASLLSVAACNTSGTAGIDPSATGAVAQAGVETGSPLQKGSATWYQSGRRTANGEAFNPGGLTAAHRTLPFGTRLRVVNETTGRSVVVRVNDRGPFVKRHIIDLARGAAQQLGMVGSGTAFVSLHKLD